MFSGLLEKNDWSIYRRYVGQSARDIDHVSYLKDFFNILTKYGMKLNPKKCYFGVTSEKFFGYLVTQRGIEANPDQINVLLKMPSSWSKNELQSLTERIVALNRFISRLQTIVSLSLSCWKEKGFQMDEIMRGRFFSNLNIVLHHSQSYLSQKQENHFIYMLQYLM